jgi:hypothetical protein
MGKTPNAKDAPVDFDDLIGTPGDPATADAAASADSGTDEPKQESARERMIRELREQVSKPVPSAAVSEDEEVDTRRNAAVLEAHDVFTPETGETQLIHVLQDGFSQFGRVWLRGQEIRIDQTAYADTKDRHGNSWLDTLLHDPHAQYARWGAVYVGPGPFKPYPGEKFEDAEAKADARRKGAAPRFKVAD